MKSIKTFCVLLLFVFITSSLFAAYDPFTPKNEITLWLDADNKKTEAAKSFISQAGFLAVSGEIRGKALITNLDYLSPQQLEAIEAYLKNGGKLILLGTTNFGNIDFLGKQYVGGDLSYLEVVDPSFQQNPKVISIPKKASPVSIIANNGSEVLAEFLAADGVSKSHIEQLNSAVLKTTWGLYSGFDWFDGTFLEDPSYRQLFILWLRKTIWN